MNVHNRIQVSENIQKIDSWFDEFIGKLEMDKYLLKEDIASADTKKAYEILMSDNKDQIIGLARDTSSIYFIEKLIIEYMTELKKSEAKFSKLALDLGNSKLLSWVEIETDDEKSEDKLIMAEARVNAKFSEFGFHISTTIVEDCDNIGIPSHYNVIV